MIVTSSIEGVHVPLEIVQRKTEIPALIPVTVEPGDDGEMIVPVPEINVHMPVPTEGVLPASVAVELQIDWLGPALAVVGGRSRVIVTSSYTAGHVPLGWLQRKMFAPAPRPVTFVVGDVGETIVPFPEMSVHVPVPVMGALPLNVVEVAQMA